LRHARSYFIRGMVVYCTLKKSNSSTVLVSLKSGGIGHYMRQLALETCGQGLYSCMKFLPFSTHNTSDQKYSSTSAVWFRKNLPLSLYLATHAQSKSVARFGGCCCWHARDILASTQKLDFFRSSSDFL